MITEKDLADKANKYAEWHGIINNPVNQENLSSAFIAGFKQASEMSKLNTSEKRNIFNEGYSLGMEKSERISEWVDCRECKPETLETVLIYCNQEVSSGYYVKSLDSFFELYPEKLGIIVNVEWWQPLPQPPKKR